MKFFASFVALSLCMGSTVFGSVVEMKGQAKDVTVSGKVYKVSPEATLNTHNGPVNLKLTGYGVRQKSVAFVRVNVYLATSYIDVDTQMSPSNPIESIKDSKGRVIVLDMLRAMSAADIRSAFEEALDLNGVDVNAKAVQAVFSKFTGDLKEGNRIILASYPGERASESLIIELPGKSAIQESGNFLGLDFWKIWFGEPVDKLMGDLRSKLTGEKQ
jgi:hypothetical protein